MTLPSSSRTAVQGQIPCTAWDGRTVELVALLGITLLLNLPLLLTGMQVGDLAYSRSAVASGEWWRLITHPFIHVSRYHLILDGVAFALLYNGLHEANRSHRLATVGAAAAGSLIIACLASPLIATRGLCGLSGVAHGLMAVSALETVAARNLTTRTRRIAAIAFAAVVAKCAIECVAGTAFFAQLHPGDVGIPILECHAGGVLGAIVWLGFAKRWERRRRNRTVCDRFALFTKPHVDSQSAQASPAQCRSTASCPE